MIPCSRILKESYVQDGWVHMSLTQCLTMELLNFYKYIVHTLLCLQMDLTSSCITIWTLETPSLDNSLMILVLKSSM